MLDRSTFNSSKSISISVTKILVLEFTTESFTKSRLDAKNDEINNLVGTCSQK